MSNKDTLQFGSRKVKDMIARHMLNKILVPMAKDFLDWIVNNRIALGHNMTGNTVNAYAVGVYVSGRLVWIQTPAGSIPRPLRRKLTTGNRAKRTTAYFPADWRWDGDEQQSFFMAKVQTNSATEADRSIFFLKSYQANPKGWTLVVCNGVEYATFQENEMNIDVLTAGFDYAKMAHVAHFVPIAG